MVAPFVDAQETRVYGAGTPTGSIQFVAPQIGGALTPTFSAAGAGMTLGFDIASAAIGERYGGRLVFSATQDFSARKWFYFRSIYSKFGLFNFLETLDNGGLSILFYDTSGNWSEFNWHGTEWRNIDGTVGGWQHFTSDSRSASVVVDMESTPANASGVVDWSAIAGIEIHIRFAAATTSVVINFGAMSITDGWAIVGGEALNEATFAPLDAYASTASNNFTYYQAFRALTKNYDGQIGTAYSCRGDAWVGNGTDLTVFDESGFSLSFYPTQGNDAGATFSGNSGSMPHVAADSGSRFFTVNQSASDDVTFRDARWSGFDTAGGDFNWQCIGSTAGSCLVTGCQIFRAGQVFVGHSINRGVTYSDCYQVEINLNSLVAGSRIASSAGKGLYVTGGAGDYSANTIALEDETASVHVTIADGAAGTYDLTGLSDVGQTVVFHNESATSAITVQVNEDFGPTSTTTAGGAITIEVVAPPAVASVSNIVDGSRLRIYNVTQDVETFNDIISGTTTYSQAYTTGTTYTNGDVIRVYLTYQSGTSAKLGFQATAVASSSGWSVLADQQDDTVYNLNAIDGSLVSKFAADYGGAEIDISAASNFSSQEFYAWWSYNLTTELGMRNFFGGYTAEDAANYRNNTAIVSIYWDNLTTTNVYQTDSARIYRSDGLRPVKNGGATTGGGGVDLNWREKVLLATTGGGPLTPTQEARLLACALESKQDTLITNVSAIPTNPLLANDERVDNLDAAVSTRLAATDYTTPPTVEEIDAQLTLTHDAGSWAGSGGDDAATIYTYFTDGARADAFKATGFSTFNPVTQSVTVGAMESGTITASVIANNAFTNSAFTTGYYNSINAEVDTALTDYNLPTVSANIISVNGVAVTGVNDFKADISAIPTNPLLANDPRLDRIDVNISTRLPISGYTTPPTVSDIDTQLSLTHGQGLWTGSGGDSAVDIYAYFTSDNNADAFKADVSNISIPNVVDANIISVNGVVVESIDDFKWGSGPSSPGVPVSNTNFKTTVALDIGSTFINPSEFAEPHLINGVEVFCVVDEDIFDSLDDNDQTNNYGVFTAEKMIYISESVYTQNIGPRPVEGERLSLDDENYYVHKCTVDSGMYEIAIGKNSP